VNFRDGMLGPYLRADSMWWFAGIFALVGVIVFVVTGFVARRIYIRKQGYYETRATIADKYISTASDSTNYYIHFRYQDRSGRPIEQHSRVSKKEYPTYRIGDPLQVYVTSADENDAWPVADGIPTYLIPAILVAFASVWFFPGAVVARRHLREIFRRVNLLRNGQLVTGRVEKIVPKQGRKHIVQWSWKGTDGRTRKGKSPPLPSEIAHHWNRGDEIAVYTHLTDPKQAEADVFGVGMR
jgi:hypothetical protein